MIADIVLLSGPVGSGKTTLAKSLAERYNLFHYKSSESLLEIARERGIPLERKALQELGASLDRRTKGEWVLRGLAERLKSISDPQIIIVDAVRIQKQIDAFRAAYGLNVIHVHLTAPNPELERRYLQRVSEKIRELPAYRDVQENSIERRYILARA